MLENVQSLVHGLFIKIKIVLGLFFQRQPLEVARRHVCPLAKSHVGIFTHLAGEKDAHVHGASVPRKLLSLQKSYKISIIGSGVQFVL